MVRLPKLPMAHPLRPIRPQRHKYPRGRINWLCLYVQSTFRSFIFSQARTHSVRVSRFSCLTQSSCQRWSFSNQGPFYPSSAPELDMSRTAGSKGTKAGVYHATKPKTQTPNVNEQQQVAQTAPYKGAVKYREHVPWMLEVAASVRDGTATLDDFQKQLEERLRLTSCQAKKMAKAVVKSLTPPCEADGTQLTSSAVTLTMGAAPLAPAKLAPSPAPVEEKAPPAQAVVPSCAVVKANSGIKESSTVVPGTPATVPGMVDSKSPVAGAKSTQAPDVNEQQQVVATFKGAMKYREHVPWMLAFAESVRAGSATLDDFQKQLEERLALPARRAKTMANAVVNSLLSAEADGTQETSPAMPVPLTIVSGTMDTAPSVPANTNTIAPGMDTRPAAPAQVAVPSSTAVRSSKKQARPLAAAVSTTAPGMVGTVSLGPDQLLAPPTPEEENGGIKEGSLVVQGTSSSPPVPASTAPPSPRAAVFTSGGPPTDGEAAPAGIESGVDAVLLQASALKVVATAPTQQPPARVSNPGTRTRIIVVEEPDSSEDDEPSKESKIAAQQSKAVVPHAVLPSPAQPAARKTKIPVDVDVVIKPTTDPAPASAAPVAAEAQKASTGAAVAAEAKPVGSKKTAAKKVAKAKAAAAAAAAEQAASSGPADVKQATPAAQPVPAAPTVKPVPATAPTPFSAQAQQAAAAAAFKPSPPITPMPSVAPPLPVPSAMGSTVSIASAMPAAFPTSMKENSGVAESSTVVPGSSTSAHGSINLASPSPSVVVITSAGPPMDSEEAPSEGKSGVDAVLLQASPALKVEEQGCSSGLKAPSMDMVGMTRYELHSRSSSKSADASFSGSDDNSGCSAPGGKVGGEARSGLPPVSDGGSHMSSRTGSGGGVSACAGSGKRGVMGLLNRLVPSSNGGSETSSRTGSGGGGSGDRGLKGWLSFSSSSNSSSTFAAPVKAASTMPLCGLGRVIEQCKQAKKRKRIEKEQKERADAEMQAYCAKFHPGTIYKALTEEERLAIDDEHHAHVTEQNRQMFGADKWDSLLREITPCTDPEPVKAPRAPIVVEIRSKYEKKSGLLKWLSSCFGPSV